ncbi:Por secretion system C-terminal sorting domain-containing protein [Spirosomataceae bacterium TFI 002]|nr:Por secretion system C-terminal sorting domain-containing protein [Spirosomataceae bacterium TFI 002]
MKSLFKTLLLLIPFVSSAQIQFELDIKFDENSKTYNVYAIPNFSMEKFLMGPSQVSIIFPQNLEDMRLDIESLNGGQWADNSVVFAPKTQSECDFHGFGSNGGEIFNVIADHPIELFKFSISGQQLSGTRLYELAKDPKSYDEGMQGSDFRHSLIAHNGEEMYAGNVVEINEALLVSEISAAVDVFPNPSNGIFNVQLNGFEKDRKYDLKFYNISGTEVFTAYKSLDELENQKVEIPRSLEGQRIYLRVIDQEGQSHSKRILFN